MKTKHLLYGLGVLILIASTIIFANRLANKKPTAMEKSFLPGLDTAKVAEIRISEKGSVVELKRLNGRWVLPAFGNYKADSSKTNKALRHLADLEKRDLISSNPGKQSNFEVDSAKGCRIEVKVASGTVGDFWIGKSGADWRSNYLRKEGSSEVYSSSISIKWDFNSSAKEWKAKSLWELNASTVTFIEVAHDSGKYTVRKTSSGIWQKEGSDSAAADSTKMAGYLQNLCQLQVDDWAGPEDGDLSKLFKKPAIVIQVKTADGSGKTLIIGEKQLQFSPVTLAGDPLIYKFYDYRVSGLKRSWKSLEAAKANLEQTLQSSPPAVIPGN